MLTVRGLAVVLLTAAAAIAGVFVIDRAAPVFALLAGALTAAVIAAPVVRALSAHMPRGAALVIVTLVAVVGTAAVLGTLAWDLDRQARHLAAALHDTLAGLEPDGRAAHLANDLELDRRIDAAFDGAAARLVVGDARPLTAAALLGKTVVVAVLAAFMVTGGRRVFESVVHIVRRTSIREELHLTTNQALARAGGYLRRTIMVSALHGLFAGLVATGLGLPGAITIGGWVAIAATVPVLGGALAWLPIVPMAAMDDGLLWVSLAAALVACAIDAMARARWVHATVRVGPVLALAGIAVGHELIGVSGALVGLFVVATVAAVVDEPHDVAEAMVDLVEDPPDREVPSTVDHPVDGDTPSDRAVPVIAEVRDERALVYIEPSGRSAATVAAVVIALAGVAAVVSGCRSVLVWFAVGAFVAIGVDRPVSAAQRRWGVPRPAATAGVLAALVGIVAAVVVLAGPSITDSAATVASDAPHTVEAMEALPLVGDLLARHDASQRVEDWLATLPERLRENDAASRIASAAGDGLTGAVWTIAMALAVLWDGPRLVDAVQRHIPVRRRRRAVRFGRAAYTACSNVVAAAVFVATLNGTIVMLVAVALGIPMAPVLGLWAAAWNLIPQIGGFVGGLPLVALGFGEGPWVGVVALVVFVTYQTFENHVLQPMIGSRIVHLPPIVVLVGALFGGALFGFVGALMAGPVLGVVKVAIDEFSDDAARIEDRAAPAQR